MALTSEDSKHIDNSSYGNLKKKDEMNDLLVYNKNPGNEI